MNLEDILGKTSSSLYFNLPAKRAKLRRFKLVAYGISAVQNLADATLNPFGSPKSDPSSITDQSTEPVASGEQSATSDADLGGYRMEAAASEAVGAHLDEKA